MDGALITAAPHLIFLKDTSGDGIADHQEILLHGFGEGNQQLRVNGLRLGLDNTFHLAAGGHHRGFQADTKISSTRSGQDLILGSRDASYNPVTGDFQPQSGPSQFGRERDDFDRWFGSQNSHPLWHYVLPDRYIARNPHHAVPDSRVILVPPNPPILPLSPSTRVYHGTVQAGQVTSACGQAIYRDSILFSDDGHLNAFVCEPANNLIIHYALEEDGVSFSARRHESNTDREFIASPDTWFRPVMARTGPDGSLYIADMYRAMIEHPHWIPEGARGRLAPLYRQGDDRGRIYRIRREGAPLRAFPSLAGLSPDALALHLDRPNGWVRDKVHALLLVDKGQPPIGVLSELATAASHHAARAHALSLLHHHQQLAPEIIAKALSDPSPGVRAHAIRLAEHSPFSNLSSALPNLLRDPSPMVQLQLALSLGEFPDTDAGESLAALAMAASADPWIVSASLTSATPHLPILISTLAEKPEPGLHLARPLANMAFAAGEPKLLEPLALRAFPPTTETPQNFHLALAKPLLQASGGSPLPGIAPPRHSHLISRAHLILGSSDSTPTDRLLAAQLLSTIPEELATALPSLAALIDPVVPPATQAAALGSLASSGHESIPTLIMSRWQTLPPSSRSLALDTLLTRETWTLELLSAVREDDITPADIDAARRARLHSSTSAKVKELAALTLPDISSPDRESLIEKFSPALTLKGDTARGRAVFLATCVSCHQLDGIGLDVGPDIASFTAHPPEKLLSAILDPSADIQPGYAVYECALDSGEQIQGFIAAETASSITLRLPSGTTRTIPRQEIRSMRSLGTSLMPEGLEVGLDLQSMADLLSFLASPGS
jgi:putative membrane-bound dehydrogenase-like protein